MKLVEPHHGSAIIMESWDNMQIIDKITVANNKINDNEIGLDVQNKTKDIEIFDNEATDNFSIISCSGTCNIYNNKIKNAALRVMVEESAYSNGRRVNKAIVKDNNLINSELYILNVENAAILSNKIYNSSISIYATDCIIDKNKVKNLDAVRNWALRYGVLNFNKAKYNVYLGENEYEGNFREKENIMIESVVVNRENIYEYYKEKFEN